MTRRADSLPIPEDAFRPLPPTRETAVQSQVRQVLGIARAVTIRGWMSDDELNWLASTASRSHAAVEIGSYCGRSSRAIADNLPDGGVLYCVDAWKPFECVPPVITTPDEGEAVYAEFLRNMSDVIDNGTVTVRRMGSVKAAVTLNQDVVDFVFIDGDHSYNAVSQDIRLWLPLVKSGGIISGHDYGVYQGVNEAVHERFGQRYDAVQHPAGSIWAVQL